MSSAELDVWETGGVYAACTSAIASSYHACSVGMWFTSSLPESGTISAVAEDAWTSYKCT